jgi:exodeoxyribonuclease-3
VSLRLLSYNIRHGGVGREKPISDVIDACDVDLVVLQEAIRPDVVEGLARNCSMKSWGAIRGHSLAYLSRRPLSHHAWHVVRFARRRYLELVLAPSGPRIFGVHLSAVHSNVTERRRAYEMGALLRGIERHQHGFHMVMGDFNTLAPGEKLDISRLPARLRAIVYLTGRTIRWTTIQMMIDAGYTDGFRMFAKDDAGYTFPTWDPHVRLDYLFVPTSSATRVVHCEVVRRPAAVRDASDHFPLLTEISD